MMKWFLFLMLFGVSQLVLGQKNMLLPQDSVYLARLHKELTLTEIQKQPLDSIYIKYTLEIYFIDKAIKSVQQSDSSEELINSEVSKLNEERKLKKDLRELDLLSILNEQQKRIYAEKIKPAKPQVLHFGINHDRASCVICE